MKANDTKIKVLMFTERWNSGGIESVIMNIYQNIDWNKFTIDILMAQDESSLYDNAINKKNGHKMQILDKKEKSPIIRTIKTVFTFRKKIKKGNYNIIHIHMSNGIGFLYAFLAKTVGIKKIIVHSHNTNVGKKNNGIKEIVHIICKYIFQWVPTNYFACSEEAAKWVYTKKTMKSDNFQIIKNAIDLEKYSYNVKDREEFRKENNIEEEFVIGHVGRFNEQKNHIFLIDIFEKIHDVENKSKLILIGEGEEKENIYNIAQNKNLLNDVIFYGTTDNVSKCMSGFDIFVLPSLYEGNPVVGIEAQASGLKCFFANTITSSAKIIDKVEYISLNQSPEFWAKKILDGRIYKRVDTKDEFIKKGYDIKSLIKMVEKIYDNEDLK